MMLIGKPIVLGVALMLLPVIARAQIPNYILDNQMPPAKTSIEAPDAEKPAKELPVEKPSFFIVNNNVFGYYYVFDGTNPGAGTTPKNVLFYNHFDVWDYGTNYLQIEYSKATNGSNPPFGTPKAPCDQGGPDYPPGADQCDGYSEVYGFWRGTYGWNQLFDTDAYSIGPLTNIGFAIGFDLNWDDTTLASRKRSIQGGLQFDFATPYEGFLNVGVYAYKEWQNDGFASTFPFQPVPNPSGDVDFDPTWALELNYSQPLGDSPFRYKGLLVMHGPKGCGEPCQPLGPGLIRTTELLTQHLIVFDVGAAFWDMPDRFGVFGGYRYWDNKFGIEPNQPNGPFIGTTESTWMVGTAIKF